MRTLTLLIALAVLALPAVASGKENPGVVKTGRCSNGATWKLKAKNDDARIEGSSRSTRTSWAGAGT